MLNRARYMRAVLCQPPGGSGSAAQKEKCRARRDVIGLVKSVVVVALSLALLAGISPKSPFGAGVTTQQIASNDVAVAVGSEPVVSE